MSKFNQILNKQRQEKNNQVEPSQSVIAPIEITLNTEETASPVQRRTIAGAQHGVSLKRLSVDLIDHSPYQPRFMLAINVTELQELAENIRNNGQINPILVRPKNGRYELVGGERRLYAVKEILKLKDIDCLIKDISDEKAAITALVDNINRADLSDYEVAHALQKNCIQFGYPIDQAEFITEKFNISRNKYYRLISLFDLPDFIHIELQKEPLLLSGSGASLLKTSLNKATELVGKNKALSLLNTEWSSYVGEFSGQKKRHTQFIKKFEQHAQDLYQQSDVVHVSDQEPTLPVNVSNSVHKKELNICSEQSLSVLNQKGRKFGSLKCIESSKGKTIVSIRLSVDEMDETKIERLKEFLKTLD